MNRPSEAGRMILRHIVECLGNGRNSIGYRETVLHLGLEEPNRGETWGECLTRQGLEELAIWARDNGKPAITGFIVSEKTKRPEAGYYDVNNRQRDDLEWWRSQLEDSRSFNWKPYYDIYARPNAPPTPFASDLGAPPDRVITTTYRVLRDTELARRIKELHDNVCQVCRCIIELPNGSRYSEAHHVIPLADPNTRDSADNIVCVCPNCHAKLDLFAIGLSIEELLLHNDHVLDSDAIEYHNNKYLTKWQQDNT